MTGLPWMPWMPQLGHGVLFKYNGRIMTGFVSKDYRELYNRKFFDVKGRRVHVTQTCRGGRRGFTGWVPLYDVEPRGPL